MSNKRAGEREREWRRKIERLKRQERKEEAEGKTAEHRVIENVSEEPTGRRQISKFAAYKHSFDCINKHQVSCFSRLINPKKFLMPHSSLLNK